MERIDLGSEAFGPVQVNGVNDKGQVVGTTYDAQGATRAYVHSAGVTNNLGILPDGAHSLGSGINNLGQATGSAGVADGTSRAYVSGPTGGLVDLGIPYAHGVVINDTGRVAGEYFTYSAAAERWEKHSFVWENGTHTELGTLGGVYTSVTAMNKAGQVIGQADVTNGPYGSTGIQHAYRWSGGTLQEITLGGSYSRAVAINEAGQVVGMAATAAGPDTAFLLDGATVIDLGALAGAPAYTSSEATDLNNAGEVIGTVGSRSFLYSKGVMKDLGTLGGSYNRASDINDAGQIVGSATTRRSEAGHAFLYSGGVMKDLGTLGGGSSYASKISEAGQIVGSSLTRAGVWHAFLYSNGSMTDLNTLIPVGSGWELSSADTITKSGHIIAQGTSNGQSATFVLSPASTSSGAITATDDTTSTSKSTPVDIAVLANDFSATDQPLAITQVSSPANGTISDNGDGTLKYTPRLRFAGTDSFTYSISDSDGASATATVTITVLRR